MTMNLLLTFSTLYGTDTWSNCTVTWWAAIDNTVPIAPLTSPAFVSMLRRSMTRAPTARDSLASSPAVMLQSAFILSKCLITFLVIFRVPAVSSISSIQSSLCTSDVIVLSIRTLKSSQAFLLGKRQTGVLPDCWSSVNWSEIDTCMTLSFRILTVSSVGQPRLTLSNMEENCGSFFWRSLIVNSSYVTQSFQMLMEAAHPSWNNNDLVETLSNTGPPLTGGSWRRSPTNNMFLDPNHSLPPNNSSSLMCMYARLRLDTMDTSSKINTLTLVRVAFMTFWDCFGKAQ